MSGVGRRISDHLFHFGGFLCEGIRPSTVCAVGSDRINPLLCGLRLNIGAFVVALHLDNEMQRRLGLEPHDEIWNVVVRLAVVEVRNRKTEAGVFYECINGVICIDEVRCRLFPSLRVGNYVVDMTLHDLANFSARPKSPLRLLSPVLAALRISARLALRPARCRA